MSNHANLAAALLAAFSLDTDKADPVAIADALATVLVAFADLVRGPAPVFAELAAVELAPLPGQAELIAEVRNLICEIRADRQAFAEERKTNNRLFRSFVGGMPGAEHSGLPG
ncbi:hypothetical protein [Duganella violaceipulchra]|uniref:Uncharacterized protein n=1 Tax=Duganella violaceipulchra TaxID=2849652 RepID=A0AA41H7G7_9BURK|nr:hypothetical protein [Duganella violaceicalia]MBV6321945.1 hypothetical protein [Duganella violaceicalia]MCP2007061.1 hypothetical protein [Duganella violaceicalia]